MTMHVFHPYRSERDEFLVDGCPRCEEYVRDLGLPFDADRFRAFWRKMIDVEFENASGYASRADKALGTKLYYVALSFQRAFGIDPADLDEFAARPLIVPAGDPFRSSVLGAGPPPPPPPELRPPRPRRESGKP